MRRALLLLALAACGSPSPGPGVECLADAGTHCTDAGTFLSCEGGKWAEFPCTGHDGCKALSPALAYCDFTGTDAGLACPSSVAEQVDWCTTDQTHSYSCTGGVFVEHACTQGCDWRGTYPGLSHFYGHICHVVP